LENVNQSHQHHELPEIAMTQHLWTSIVHLSIVLSSCLASAQEAPHLENGQMGLSFDGKTGSLTAIENKLTAETYRVCGDMWDIDAVDFHATFADLKLLSVERQGDSVMARYTGKRMTVEATYTLRGENHFVEKQLTLTCDRSYGLKKVVVSHPTFIAPGLRIVDYRPLAICTFFGRTAKGGFFTGSEVPFDGSAVKGDEVILQYSPSLKVAARERVVCEPVFLGVYRRGRRDVEQTGLPLRSESDAMVAMTSTILGPPRFGLMPWVNGWCSEMHQTAYTRQALANGEVRELDAAGQQAALASDLRALEVIAECGIDGFGDSRPWGGVATRMSDLGPNDPYKPPPTNGEFLKRAEELGIKVCMFSTINNSHPWWKGKAFRPDRPDWVLDAGASPPASASPWRKVKEGPWNAGGNCLAIREFASWLERMNLEIIAKSPYPAWGVDGDFFGGGGAVVPADCQSDKHDHLPGDSNYACQQALTDLMATIREHAPQTCITAARPPMDLGVWALRNVDACLTLNELGTGSDNVAGGNQIRTWGRIRVQRHFFPHYIDLPQLFPVAPGGPYPTPADKWPKGHFDYILLSALSTCPNQLFYLPLKTGFPGEDKAEIKKWLDWGRKNVEYLMVRRDLPDWPAADKVDGSAHVIGDRGLIFLFNPSQSALVGEFDLTEDSIGLRATGNFQVSQEYPTVDRKITSASGHTVRWEVPPTTAVVLRVLPAAP
jgi:hypothetical protein